MVRSIQAERGSSLADETESRFPTGKLVFLMPTKPLVTQQHEACQTSCGIPSADTATVTGDDPEKWRDEAVSMMGSWFTRNNRVVSLIGVEMHSCRTVVKKEGDLRYSAELLD
jgi:hypothetical protein